MARVHVLLCLSLSSAISRQSPCNLQALNSGGETPAQIAGASGHFELRDKLTAAESQPVAARHAMGLETGAPAATIFGVPTASVWVTETSGRKARSLLGPCSSKMSDHRSHYH